MECQDLFIKVNFLSRIKGTNRATKSEGLGFEVKSCIVSFIGQRITRHQLACHLIALFFDLSAILNPTPPQQKLALYISPVITLHFTFVINCLFLGL